MVEWVAPDQVEVDWHPSEDVQRAYGADLELLRDESGKPLVLFFAGQAGKASASTTIIDRYRYWGLDVTPVATYSSSISSPTIIRLQDSVRDSDGRSFSIEANEQGLRTLWRELGDLGVSLVSSMN